MIKIIEVKTKKQTKMFAEFPIKLYKNNKYFVPQLISDEIKIFDKNKNPSHEYCDSVRFLAYKNNKIVGRIAGIVNFNLNKEKNERTLRFTRLDMYDDIEITKKLFEELINWGRKFKLNKLIGPIGFSDLDKQGLLIEGYEEKGSFITLYNHPYYLKHLTILGFIKDVDWVEKRIFIPKTVPDKLKRISNLVQSRYGYEIVDVKSKKDLKSLIPDIFKIYNDAFMKLYGFYPLTDKVRDYYINQFITVIRLDYVWVIKNNKNELVGFGLINSCLADAVRKSKGKLFPLGWYRILRSIKKNNIVDFYFIAVRPEDQNNGIAAIILEKGAEVLVKNKIIHAETGPELENNNAIQSIWKDFEHINHKRRRCFKKDI